MAKFEFKLEALLRLRELEEDRAKRRFFDLLGARRRKEQEMHEVIREREDAKVRLRGGDGFGAIDAARLVAERRRLAALLEEAAVRREEAQRIQPHIERARVELRDARRQRKQIEVVRARHREAFDIEESRRALREEDDLVRSCSPRGGPTGGSTI